MDGVLFVIACLMIVKILADRDIICGLRKDLKAREDLLDELQGFD